MTSHLISEAAWKHPQPGKMSKAGESLEVSKPFEVPHSQRRRLQPLQRLRAKCGCWQRSSRSPIEDFYGNWETGTVTQVGRSFRTDCLVTLQTNFLRDLEAIYSDRGIRIEETWSTIFNLLFYQRELLVHLQNNPIYLAL